MKRIFFLFVLYGIAAFAAEPSRPNVVLITIDTLRADRLGCYGYARAQTPHLDRLASESILFTNAVSHVPLTRPSHASLFTGLYPFEHGIHDNVAPALDPKIPTLAESLRKQGYDTAAFVAAFVVNSQSGLQRGFDVYEDDFDPQKQPTQFALNMEKRGEQVYQEFSGWLKQPRKGPYFAWIHLYDPHFPYEPPAPYAKKFTERPYDGEVAYTDEITGRILKLLSGDTLLVVTSDHGESLGDHGENAHSFFIYDSTLHIPLMIRWPHHIPAGKKITFQTRLVDVAPTILDFLNIPLPGKISGVSLKPWISGPQKDDPQLISYSETFTPWLHFGWSRLQGVRTGGWKYIEAPRPELFNLALDPGESRNLYTSTATRARDLKQWLVRSGALQQSAPQAVPQLDPETLEKLASLGYAGVTGTPPPSGLLADPKDKLEDFKLFNTLIREGIEAFQQERYSEAASSFQKLRSRNIPSFEVHYYLGRSLLRLKSYDKCRTELELALQKLPHFLPAYRDLSEAWEGSGNLKEAEKALLAGLVISPDNPTLVHPLAWLYQKQKKMEDAESLLLSTIRTHSEDVESRFRLGAIYRDTGHTESAIEQFAEVIRQRPENAEAHNQLGMLYGGSGRLEEALTEFEQAAKLSPETPHIHENLKLAKSRLAETTTFRFRIIQTKTRQAADLLLRKLNAGEDWNALSGDYSIHPASRTGNPVLEARSTEIATAFTNALAKLKPGQISGVIETQSGFYLLRRE